MLLEQDIMKIWMQEEVILLSALGLVDFNIISLCQTGVIKHLPYIPHPLFNSDKVNA